MTCRLSNEVAAAALQVVPRLQRKHYEMIPKSLSELDFFICFFSHVTAIVDLNCPGAMTPDERGDEWKGIDEREGSNGFEAAWAALQSPSPASPPGTPSCEHPHPSVVSPECPREPSHKPRYQLSPSPHRQPQTP